MFVEFTLTTADEQGAKKLLPKTVTTLTLVESMRVVVCSDEMKGE